MSLAAGSRLGPYEIRGPLGAGGMGEVYRAHDGRLDRDVAIKVIPESVAQDPDRLARFEREAKALAALNHPNIAAIYGVEERALVMELVEGQDLQGPLPADIAIHYARQIAEALEAAHEKGIVHRDLKPANIKVTPQGVVKVLDFGLAAMTQNSAATAAGDPASSPTLTMRATQAGVIMGTAAYMSPEQAAGKPVDRRADIWSFGVVLWEMLTGRRLFDGETVSHTLADVLRSEIDFKVLPAGTPAAVRSLLKRCLDRNVRNRLRDIGEARIALETAGQAGPDPAPAPAPNRPVSRLPWMITAAAIFVALGLDFLYWWKTRPVLRPAQRFDVPFTAPDRLHSFLALSPDGTRVAYVVKGQDGIQRIYTRLLSQPEGAPLQGTEGAVSPFFSPDGQWLAFGAERVLKKILLAGGSAVRLCDAPDLRGGSWGDDGDIVFAPDGRSPLMRVSEAGGTARPLTQLISGEITHRYPQVLPGSKSVLFSANNSPANFENSTIQLFNLATNKAETIHKGGFGARYLDGRLLWAHEGSLFSAPVDLEKAQLRGSAIPVLEKLASDPSTGLGNFEISAAGIYVGVSGDPGNRTRALAWVDAQGKTQPLPVEPREYGAMRLSPDGKRLAVAIGTGPKSDLFLYDFERAHMTQMTFNLQAGTPLWAPDGKHLVFQTMSQSKLYWLRTDGSIAPEVLFTPSEAMRAVAAYSFSPDGKHLLVGASLTTGDAIWMVALDLADPDHPKAGPAERIPGTDGQALGMLSPDGRWLAYLTRSQRMELYVEPYPPTGAKRLISGEANGVHAWSRAGQELFYPEKGQVMAVPWRVEGNSFVAEKPRVWNPSIKLVGGQSWEVSPDGKRTLVQAPSGDAAPGAALTFIVNFKDELQRRVPK